MILTKVSKLENRVEAFTD